MSLKGKTIAVTGAFGLRPSPAVATVSIVYATLAISMWLLPRFRRGAAPQAVGVGVHGAGQSRKSRTVIIKRQPKASKVGAANVLTGKD